MIEEYLKRNRAIIQRAKIFNNEQLDNHSVSPQGVGWNSVNAQSKRYEQLLRIVQDQDIDVTLNDVGCGYGYLWSTLSDNENIVQYNGYDVSDNMLDATRKEHKNVQNKRVKFNHLKDIKTADYSIASGIFGMKFDFTESEWYEYILDTLNLLNQYSLSGFAFNMLTSYSEPDKCQDDLYYADPCKYFDICKRKFSRNVALLHDYDLYDFTILVRKD